MNQCNTKFLNEISKKSLISWFLKELTFVLPCLGKPSLDLRTRLRQTIERDLPYCKLKVMFRSKCRLKTLFQFKNPFEEKICSGIIYHYMCSKCKVTYNGKTFHHFYTRATEHMGISNLIKKHLKNVKESAISDHLLQCDCTINFEDFSILATDCNKFKSLPRETLLIKRDKAILNRTIKSFLLELFDSDGSFICNITWLSDFNLIYNSILFCVLTELGYVLNVMSKRNENVVLKMLW